MATLVEDDIWADEEDIDVDLLMSIYQFGESVVKNGHLAQNGSTPMAATNDEHLKLNGFASTSKAYVNGFAPTERPGVTPISTLASLGLAQYVVLAWSTTILTRKIMFKCMLICRDSAENRR